MINQIFNQKTPIKEIKDFMKKYNIKGISKINKHNKKDILICIIKFQESLKDKNYNLEIENDNEFICPNCRNENDLDSCFDCIKFESEGLITYFINCKICKNNYMVDTLL